MTSVMNVFKNPRQKIDFQSANLISADKKTVVSLVHYALIDANTLNILNHSYDDKNNQNITESNILIIASTETVSYLNKIFSFQGIKDKKDYFNKAGISNKTLQHITSTQDNESLINSFYTTQYGSTILPVKDIAPNTVEALMPMLTKAFDIILFACGNNDTIITEHLHNFDQKITIVRNDKEESVAIKENYWIVPVVSTSYPIRKLENGNTFGTDKIAGFVTTNEIESQKLSFNTHNIPSILSNKIPKKSNELDIHHNEKINIEARKISNSHKSVKMKLGRIIDKNDKTSAAYFGTALVAPLAVSIASTFIFSQPLFVFGMFLSVPAIFSVLKLGEFYEEHNSEKSLSKTLNHLIGLKSASHKKALTPIPPNKLELLFLMQKSHAQNSFSSMKQQYADLEEKWLAYELDIVNCLTYPAFIDMEVEATRNFHNQRTATAILLKNATENMSHEKHTQLFESITALDTAFHRAESYARLKKLCIYTNEEQKKINQSIKLAEIVMDKSASDTEKSLASKRLLSFIDGIVYLPQEPRAQIEQLKLLTQK